VNAVYVEHGTPFEGQPAIRSAYEASAAAFPGLAVDIVNELTSGERSAIEFEAVLTDRAGQRVRVRAVNLVEVRDGKFVFVRTYEDLPTAL